MFEAEPGRAAKVPGEGVAGSTSKKVVAVRFDREPVPGYIDPQNYLKDTGVELLSASGSVSTIPYPDVKAVCFVRDLDALPVWRQNRSFSNRPKSEGLWVRFVFRDADTIEGVLSNNLLLLDPQGFVLTPPDPGFLNQRIFIPRAAVTEATVLGVVHGPLRRVRSKPSKDQLKMFE